MQLTKISEIRTNSSDQQRPQVLARFFMNHAPLNGVHFSKIKRWRLEKQTTEGEIGVACHVNKSVVTIFQMLDKIFLANLEHWQQIPN